MSSDAVVVSLSNCDSEPIRVPGSIQPHGFLLGILLGDDDQLRVVVASENASTYLNRPLDSLLQRDLREILDSEIVTSLRKGLLSESAGGDFARFIGTVELKDASGESIEFQIVGHRIDKLYVLEFELTESSITQADLNTAIANFVTTLELTGSASDLCHSVAVQVRELTGFDRVMLYSFDEVGHGTVSRRIVTIGCPRILAFAFRPAIFPVRHVNCTFSIAFELFRMSNISRRHSYQTQRRSTLLDSIFHYLSCAVFLPYTGTTCGIWEQSPRCQSPLFLKGSCGD